MLPKNKRIPKAMFALLDGGKTGKNSLFSLRFASQKGPSRFCFSVSKKISKSAVVRNRLRRAGYRLLVKYIPRIKTDVIALFSFRKVPQSEEEIIKSMESALKESGLIK